MLRALQLGLSVADLDYMSFGMLVDLINTNHNEQEDSETTREANQADFDKW